jgi:hypothetical protein
MAKNKDNDISKQLKAEMELNRKLVKKRDALKGQLAQLIADIAWKNELLSDKRAEYFRSNKDSGK